MGGYLATTQKKKLRKTRGDERGRAIEDIRKKEIKTPQWGAG